MYFVHIADIIKFCCYPGAVAGQLVATVAGRRRGESGNRMRINAYRASPGSASLHDCFWSPVVEETLHFLLVVALPLFQET